MAKFPSLTFTEKGIQMLVQAQNSHTLTFTCGKLGSGVLTDSDDIVKFTDLKAPKMTLPITKVDDSNPEKIVLTFDTSNTSLEHGFISREIGIFAKLDDGVEALYAYSNAGSNYDYIPSKDTPTDENRLVVSLIVSSSANIAVTVDKSIVYAHMSDVEEALKAHDASETAHENRLKVAPTSSKPASMTDKGLWLETLQNNGGKLNVWDAIKKQFETVYPETEVARITDFADGIVQKLALTSAMAAITELQTDSWFGKLLKMALTASGVKYSIAENGYVCLGDLFGGLIIQWVRSEHSKESNITLPVALTSAVIALGGCECYLGDNITAEVGAAATNTKVHIITSAAKSKYALIIGS